MTIKTTTKKSENQKFNRKVQEEVSKPFKS